MRLLIPLLNLISICIAHDDLSSYSDARIRLRHDDDGPLLGPHEPPAARRILRRTAVDSFVPVANQLTNAPKIVPEPGWLPLTGPVFSDRQQPGITLIQPTPGPIVVQQIVSRPESPALTHVDTATRFTVVSSSLNAAPQKPALFKGPSLTFYPNDTFSLQYLSFGAESTQPRSERAVLPPSGGLDDGSFMARIKRLSSSCDQGIVDLIMDILQSSLRQRNALLGALKLEKTGAGPATSATLATPRPEPVPDNAKEVVTNTFNIFPGFQQRNNVKVSGDAAPAPDVALAPAQRSSRQQFHTAAADSGGEASGPGQEVSFQSITSSHPDQQKSPLIPAHNGQSHPVQQDAINPSQSVQSFDTAFNVPQVIPAAAQPSVTASEPPKASLVLPQQLFSSIGQTSTTSTPRPLTQHLPVPVAPAAPLPSAANVESGRRFTPTQISVQRPSPSLPNVAEPARAHISIEEFLERYPEVRRVSSRFNDDHDPPTPGRVGASNDLLQADVKPKPIRAQARPQQPSSFANLIPGFASRQTEPLIQFATTTTAAPSSTTTSQRTTAATARTTTPTTASPQRRSPTPAFRPDPATSTTAVPLAASTTQVTTALPRPEPPLTVTPGTAGHQQSSDADYNSDGSELSSDDYSYLYYEEYYEELVPQHHRFLQLQTTTSRPLASSSARSPQKKRGRKIKGKHTASGLSKSAASPGNSLQNQFSFFSSQPADQVRPPSEQPPSKSFPNFPLAGFVGESTAAPATTPRLFSNSPKEQPVSLNVAGLGNQAGPFGYVDKGTFFSDNFITEFPESIEIVYQGFVWAFELLYPTAGKIVHGGIHTVLKDKVKRDKIVLHPDDFIVRVEGRASPYNINRLTFHTSKGKVFGPYGDRRSEESVDFDVSAPQGHALAFLSGTIDFGVPLRSVSFHWLPIPPS